jgi:hypothetical protein
LFASLSFNLHPLFEFLTCCSTLIANNEVTHRQTSSDLLSSSAPSALDSTPCRLRGCRSFVLALETSRLDDSNSSSAGLPQSSLDPLPRVQNVAARLIFQLRPMDHVTPSLMQPHWLTIRYRVQFKLCLLMHDIHTGCAPAYLIKRVQASSSRSTREGLRSAVTTNYVIRRLRTKFGERSFLFAGPAASLLTFGVGGVGTIWHLRKLP